MGALLALIPGKDLIYGALILALLAFGAYEVHHLKAEGAAHEIAALKASSDKLQAQTAKQTADLQARATMAEQAYDKEIQAGAAYRASLPVRLCVNNANRSTVVPKAGAAVAGNENPGAATAGVPPMLAGDSGSGPTDEIPDISGLLDAFAARADQVSATLREYQKR